MKQSIIPVNIKPHLVPFLFQKLKCVDYVFEGRKIKAAKVTNHTALGRFVRLLLEKSDTKVPCDKSSQTFFLVQNYAKPLDSMAKDYKYEDGRKGFLYMPEAGVKQINEYLEEQFETASMFYIHSRHSSNTEESLDAIIIEFFEKYNLEEFDFNTLRIRQNYYRKLRDGYFKAVVHYDPLTRQVERATSYK